MRRIAPVFLLTSAVLVAQTSDSQTLQAILQEIRQVRQDLAVANIASQRVQILLYRLQLEGDAIKNATTRHDEAREKVKNAEKNHRDAANGLKAVEDQLASLTNESQRPPIEAQVREMKRRTDMWARDESDLRAVEIGADSDLKNEQAKLADLQQRLDQLERQLEKSQASQGPL